MQNPAIGSAMAQPMPTSPTGPPPPFPAPSSSSSSTTTATPTPIPIAIRPSHNDLNDVQNISKILQSSIHNGSSSTISTNHNNNHSSDKRLFGDDLLSAALTKSNHKDDPVKTSEDKQHHRSKRKPKAASVTSTPPPAVVKQNQHKHTNGLNSSTDKILSNCINLLNGDDNDDDEQMEKWKQENYETRSMAFKEIRRLGRDYNGLYEQLGKVKGTFEMRFSFLEMCIGEARRFRRNHMVICMQEWWDKRCDEKNTDATGKLKS